MKFVVLGVPYAIEGDATGTISGRDREQVRDEYADHILDMIAAHYIPDLKARLLKRVAHAPGD